MMMTFEEQGHIYRWNGQIVPSVTQILGLVGTAKKQDDGSLKWHSISSSEFIDDEVAANFGTQFHSYCEIVLKGRRPLYDPGMQPWVESWERWREKHGRLETILHESRPMIEWRHYCRRYGYAMTLDWACMDDGPVVTDWKTSDTWDEGWWIQQAPYARAAELDTGLRGWKTRVVQIRPDPQECRMVTHTPDQVRADWNTWLSIHNTFRKAA